MPVHAHGVPSRDDFSRERGIAQHLLADHEEGRASAGAGERLQHGGCPHGVRTVVERQRNGSRYRDTRRDRSAPATDGTIGASDGNDQSPRPPTAATPRGRLIAWCTREQR